MSLKTNSHGIQLRNNGEYTTRETRHDAYVGVQKKVRYEQIKRILYECGTLSAREISEEMYKRGLVPTNERNFASPRLTEMGYIGIVEPIGKKKDQWSGRAVSVWDLTPIAKEQMHG